MYDKCNLFIGSLEYTFLILFKSLTQFGRWPLTLISIASLLLLLLLLLQVVGRAGRNGGRLIRYGDEAIIVGLRRNFFSFSFSRRFFIFIQFHDVIAFF